MNWLDKTFDLIANRIGFGLAYDVDRLARDGWLLAEALGQYGYRLADLSIQEENDEGNCNPQLSAQ